jgi:hypothetical protein
MMPEVPPLPAQDGPDGAPPPKTLFNPERARDRLRAAFGPEQIHEHLLRWRLSRAGSGVLDVWLDTERPEWPEVWLSQPWDDRPCRCDLAGAEELDRLIGAVEEFLRGREPVDLDKLCRGLVAHQQEGLLLRMRRSGPRRSPRPPAGDDGGVLSRATRRGADPE